MTVSSTTSKMTYTGTTGTTFPYTFAIYNSSDLMVVKRAASGDETTLSLSGGDYTVTGAGEDSGGNVVLTASLAATETLVIKSNIPLLQSTDYTEGGPFPAASHEKALDKLTKIAQQLAEQYDRTFRTTITDTTTTSWEVPEPRDGYALGWNGTQMANIAMPGSLVVSTFGQSLLSAANADAGRETLGMADPARNRIINGLFEVWQRGTSFSGITSAQYTADRWEIDAVTYTPDVSRQDLTGYDTPGYIFRVTDASITGVAGSYLIMSQKIEDVHTFASSQCTLSIWLLAAAAGEIYVELVQDFGSGGSSDVIVEGGIKAFSTSWYHAVHTFSVPTVASKTIGTGHCLKVNIWLAGGSDFDSRTGWSGGHTPSGLTIDFVEAQLESGEGFTEFEFRSLAMEQMLCERYYRMPDYINGFVASATNVRFSGVLQPSMRSGPTISLLTTSPTVLAPSSTAGSSSSIDGSLSSSKGWQAQINGFSGLAVGEGAMMLTEGAIALDAEL